jgi:hypothetical protein
MVTKTSTRDTNMKFRLGLGLVMAALSLSAWAEDRVFEQSLELQGEKAIVIDGAVGQLEITASDDAKLHLRLEVEPSDDLSSASEAKMAEIELDIDRSSRRIKLSLELPRGLDSDDVKEHWEVQVPAGVETELDLGVGKIDVEGISGALAVSLGVGEANIDMVTGDLDLSVGVGEADVTIRKADIGRVRVDTTVGDARLRVDGERVDGTSHFGIGQAIKHKGEGEDEIEVVVKVGDVSVELESASD